MAPFFTGIAGVLGGQGGFGRRKVNVDRGIIATGGDQIVTYSDQNFNWKAHVFENSGTFFVSAIPGAFGDGIEWVVVGGGGGGGTGGDFNYGGGGAGGFRTNSANPEFSSVTTGVTYPVSQGSSYPITIGNGGTGANGSASVFNVPGVEGTTKFTSSGGGRGGVSGPPGSPGVNGSPGASGGGGGGLNPCGFPNVKVVASGNIPATTPAQGSPAPGPLTPPGGCLTTPGGSITPTGGITSIISGSPVVYSEGGSSGFYGGVGGGAYGPASSNVGKKGVVIVRYKISQV